MRKLVDTKNYLYANFRKVDIKTGTELFVCKENNAGILMLRF